MIEVRPAESDDRPFIEATLRDRWGGFLVAGHDELIDASVLPALIALQDGRPVGLLTHREDRRGWEVVSIDALLTGAGVGSALIQAVRRLARQAGARRLWLVTTNDNTRAIRFYQRQGFDLVALHRDAVVRARRLKPGIPLEIDGIPLRHELEFALEP